MLVRCIGMLICFSTLAACAEPQVGNVISNEVGTRGARVSRLPVAISGTSGDAGFEEVAEKMRPGDSILQVGEASWYSSRLQKRRTASGELFDGKKFTAAHRTLPIGTHLRVTSLATGKSVVVRINDRGPFVNGRVIDLSYAAANALGLPRARKKSVQIQRVENAVISSAASDSAVS
jgi:rare lipoprotein A